jgi:hypothetical protein
MAAVAHPANRRPLRLTRPGRADRNQGDERGDGNCAMNAPCDSDHHHLRLNGQFWTI